MRFLYKDISLIYNDNDSWYANTNENGELTLRVPNGDYTIDSFDDGDNRLSNQSNHKC